MAGNLETSSRSLLCFIRKRLYLVKPTRRRRTETARGEGPGGPWFLRPKKTTVVHNPLSKGRLFPGKKTVALGGSALRFSMIFALMILKKKSTEAVKRNVIPPKFNIHRWKITIFNRRYIFEWLVCHYHVSFLEGRYKKRWFGKCMTFQIWLLLCI